MNHKDVLKRAWDTMLSYPALLVFGIIVALTAGGGGGQGFQYTASSRDFPGRWGFQHVETSPEVVSLIIPIGASLCCLALAAAVGSVIARYVSDTALIRLVNSHEETGETGGVRHGFRQGWSLTALRFLGIDLVTGIPMTILFLLLFVLSGLPLLLWLTDSTAARAVGTVAAIGLFFLVVLLAVLVGAAVSVLVGFARRACAIEELGVIEGIVRGYRVLSGNLRDAVLMWVVMLGLGVAWAIVSAVLLALLLLVASIVGGLPGLMVGGLLGLLARGAGPWIVGSVVAAPAFIIVVGLPSIALRGLAEVFKSSVWTLTYRELHVLD
jgi:hypothetical protein